MILVSAGCLGPEAEGKSQGTFGRYFLTCRWKDEKRLSKNAPLGLCLFVPCFVRRAKQWQMAHTPPRGSWCSADDFEERCQDKNPDEEEENKNPDEEEEKKRIQMKKKIREKKRIQTRIVKDEIFQR